MKMTRWWYHIPLVFYISGNKEKENYFLKIIYEMTADIVDKRRRALEVHSDNESIDEAAGVVDRFILSRELSMQEIIWETFSLFTTVSYLLRLIGNL